MVRAGGQTLTMLCEPRIFLVLRALDEGAKAQKDLRRAADMPAQSTLRNHLRTLEAAGVASKRRRDAFPGVLEYELADAGKTLMAVAESVGDWLSLAPPGPIELGTVSAKAAIKSFVDGWLARMLAPLATEPLSLTELDRHLTEVSYPTIERRLEAMLLSEQIDTKKRDGRGTPYALSSWLRRSVTPLAMAARWEYETDQNGVDPVTRREIESAMKIGGPLQTLPGGLSGTCHIAVEPAAHDEIRSAGAIVVQGGTAAFDEVSPGQAPDASAVGAREAWFAALLDSDPAGLEISGNPQLVEALLAWASCVFSRNSFLNKTI